jgi:hypothetical protein
MRTAVAIFALASLAGCGGDLSGLSSVEPAPAVSERALAGGTDVTFLVAADSHLGVEGIEALNRVQIAAMNALPGTPYPPQIGGSVGKPLGVLFAGDLTEHGSAAEWQLFETLYGLSGKEGLLKYPVFECSGNHDRPFLHLGQVTEKVRQRHGALTYSWDWGDLHVVCLDVYPTAANLRWLRGDLAAAGRRVPVVIYFHYSILGPFSDWWSEAEKEAFAKAIEGYNVVGIFHGHFHGSYHYQWKGLDVFNIGSPKWIYHRFLAVHVTDSAFTVAAWDWDRGRWDWSVVKAINERKTP